MKLGYASGCFLERCKGFVIPHQVPDELKTLPVELQVERGYDYSDFKNVVSIHLPFIRYKAQEVEGTTIYKKTRGVNIASLKEDSWKTDLELFKKHIKEAAEKGVNYAVFHYGSCNCAGRLWRDEKHRSLHWIREKEFLIEISEIANNNGIRLLAENHPYRDGIFLNHIKHVSEIIRAHLAEFCLDFPHAYYRLTTFNNEDLKEIITRFKKNIIEVHLADNDGSNHAPLALDEGKIEWRKLLSMLQSHLLVIIELRENPQESLKKVHRFYEDRLK